MRRLLLLPLLIGLFSPSWAGLGDAEDGMEGSIVSKRIYDAWCGSIRNKSCKVKFRGQRIIVNDGTGVLQDQVLEISQKWLLFMINRDSEQNRSDHGALCVPISQRFGRPSCQNHFWITYKASSGKTRIALIRFSHEARSNQFRRDLENWSGIKLRGTGPTIKIEN